MKRALIFVLLLMLAACQSIRVETRTDRISYTAEETTVQEDESMLKGQEKLLQEAVPGIKEIVKEVELKGDLIVLEKIVSERIIEEAKPAIMLKGVKEIKQRVKVVTDPSIETIVQDDPELESGQEKEIQAGVAGQIELTYEDIYIRDMLVESKVIKRRILVEAEPRIIGVGKKITDEKPEQIKPPIETSGTYTIKRGDTLYSIAKAYNTTVEALSQLNSLSDVGVIEVGQVIKVSGTVVETPADKDYSSISNTDLSWWFQPGPPSMISSDVENLLASHRVLWQLSPERNVVYLTFDEGYEYGNNTSKILATLKDKGVKATFFLTGDYVDDHPDIVQQMVDDGHQLGNHTINHLRAAKALSQSTDTYINDVVELSKKVPAMTKLHRPPEGGYSERSLQILDDLGYTTVFWSFAYKDWLTNDQPDPAWAKQTVLNNLHPGSIILLHPVSDTNVAILGELIEAIWAQGYSIEQLPTN